MNFSMPSYLIGVGTVVGAIAVGFGGGVILTNSAVKEAATPARVERVAHPDVPPAKIVARVENAKVDANAPAGAANASPAMDNTQTPVTVIPLDAKASSAPLAPQTADQSVAPNSAAPVQQVLASDSEQVSAGEAERQRRAEKRLQRKRLQAERRAKAQAVAKMRQQQFEVREQQARPELAFERDDDSGLNFFGRSNPPQTADRD